MKTIKSAEIHLVAFGFQGHVGTIDMEQVENRTTEQLLDAIYHMTQNLNRDGWLQTLENAVTLKFVLTDESHVAVINDHRSLRSLSVDDVIVINYSDGTQSIHKVDFIGFETMSELEFDTHNKKAMALVSEKGCVVRT